MATARPLAVVTGASTGIGFELAQCCADHGYDLLIAADNAEIEAAALKLRESGARVDALRADLATQAGVDQLVMAAGGRRIEALLANAGHGLGGPFLEQTFDDVRHVIDTNITGTVYLIQQIGRDMLARRNGRILITGSIAGYMPGTFSAVYNGTKAFIDSFAAALRNELKDTGVTVTCLMPGVTDTDFFRRAGMLDTKVGTEKKADPRDVAKIGFQAMLSGEGDVVAGFSNKLRAAASSIMPSGALAEQHRKMAEPGSARPGRARH